MSRRILALLFFSLTVLSFPKESHAGVDDWIQQAVFAKAVALLENYERMMERDFKRFGSYESSCLFIEKMLGYFDLEYLYLYEPSYHITFRAQNMALTAIKEKYCSKYIRYADGRKQG